MCVQATSRCQRLLFRQLREAPLARSQARIVGRLGICASSAAASTPREIRRACLRLLTVGLA
eukprot:6286469-Alexandrium_andersonii.AAC.1